MKQLNALFLFFFVAVNICSNKIYGQDGITVAGGNGVGQGANQLNLPAGVFVDATGNLYIADFWNNRIQKWAPGATQGVTVVGGTALGSGASQLQYPANTFVDAAGNIYIADQSNHRIQKWAPGATAGITVAGGNGNGSAANQLIYPSDVYVDSIGNVYVADEDNSRVQKWAPGATQGITVAGGNGWGTALNQVKEAYAIAVDKGGNIFIADGDNNRVVKWAYGATQGVVVAGAGGPQPDLNDPIDVALDQYGNLFVTDRNNQRIVKYPPGATRGYVVAGDNGRGSADNQLYWPNGVAVDATGNIFVVDVSNFRVQKFPAQLGLNYKYYEGGFNVVPDFTKLTPVKTGRASNFEIGIHNPGVNDSFAIVWEGMIDIKTAGTYIFETVSDDASKLYFNSFYSPTAVPLVNNDSTHPPKAVSATVNIPAPGKYPFALAYVENYGLESLQVNWSGPGFVKQPIPDLAFTPAANTDVEPPSIPLNLKVVSTGGSFINLDWDNSTDNTGVTAYDIYVNGIKKFTTTLSELTVDNLAPNTSYTFTVLAKDLAGNASGLSNAITGATSGVVNGLNYKYYEGSWTTLPDFSTLTPVKTGTSLIADISLRPAGKEDNFAFVWEGYITIPTTGTYTFETISDDGSKLYFNSLYTLSATALVSNDGIHPAVRASGSVYVASPGSYPITITFFNKDGGKSLDVYWTGPGIARQIIPNTAFTLTNPGVQHANLTYKYYEGSWTSLPDFTTLTPVKTGASTNVDLNARTPNRNDNFAFLWEGHINIPTPGTYTFETMSDDGSRFYFNSLYSPTAVPTIDNDGLHAATSVSSTINIAAAGTYPVAISFFESTGGESMKVYWSGPGFTRQEIPDAVFGTSSNDLTPPSDPVNLRALYSGRGFVYLDWDNSTDDAGVIAYDVYVNGTKKYSSVESAITADGLEASTSYIFTIKARDLAGNISSPGNEVTASTTAADDGLKYRYYEGSWTTLPDFNTLTAVKTGSSPNVDINVRNGGVNDNFAFVWEGYINIPNAGTYTFETISDDGSKVYFNSFYDPSAIATVNNDGVHPATSATGTVNIPAAGVYPISITYLEKDGGEQMQVYWSGPNITRRLIPNSAFSQAPAAPPPTSGLNYKYYEGTWTTLPNFNALTPVKTGSSDNIDLGVRTPGRNDNFALLWEGFINIPAAGTYTFETVSDDGSNLYFNNTYNALTVPTVNNDGLHASKTVARQVVIASAGLYPIAVTFFENDGNEQMEVYWTGPGIPRQRIPNAAFFRTPASLTLPEVNNTRDIATITPANATLTVKSIYPNPFKESFKIDFYNAAATNNIHVDVYDLKGRLLYRQQAATIPVGNNTMKVNLGNQQLPQGIYMVRLLVNGVPLTVTKLVKLKN